MINNLQKTLYLLSLAVMSLPQVAFGQGISIDVPTNFADFSSQDLTTTIENIVRIVIGFLGVLVIAAIIFGGFKMIISRGNSDDVADGRKIVTAGAIGLIILLSAYAISVFVIRSLEQAV